METSHSNLDNKIPLDNFQVALILLCNMSLSYTHVLLDLKLSQLNTRNQQDRVGARTKKL